MLSAGICITLLEPSFIWAIMVAVQYINDKAEMNNNQKQKAPGCSHENCGF